MGRRTSVSSFPQPLGQASLVSAPGWGGRGSLPRDQTGLKVAALWPVFSRLSGDRGGHRPGEYSQQQGIGAGWSWPVNRPPKRQKQILMRHGAWPDAACRDRELRAQLGGGELVLALPLPS